MMSEEEVWEYLKVEMRRIEEIEIREELEEEINEVTREREK